MAQLTLSNGESGLNFRNALNSMFTELYSGSPTYVAPLAIGSGGTGLTAFGTGVATALGQNVNGSGAISLTTGAMFVTPVLGAATGTSLALGGATIGTNALAVTGATSLNESVGTSALTIVGATQTASYPFINASQTWNNAAVTFTGLKLNITNTASQSTSKLFDIQVNGGSVAWIYPSGTINTNGNINFGATLYGSSSGANIQLYDAYISRDATNVIGLVNGTNAQSFRVYNTSSSANANYERGVFGWTDTSNVLTIGTQNAGTGTARNLQFVVGGVTVGGFTSAGITNANAAALMTTTVALNNGAGASAGTITNAPSVGNPTKWIPINDNGTTRYVPAW